MILHKFRDPFDWFVIENLLEPAILIRTTEILKTAIWQFEKSKLYRIYKIDEESLQKLRGILKNTIERALCEIFSLQDWSSVRMIGLSAHKYSKDCGIQAHTDFEREHNKDALRMVCNINAVWNPSYGGMWILSASESLSEPRKIVPPKNNLAFGFKPTENSFHALSRVNFSEIYAIVFDIKFT